MKIYDFVGAPNPKKLRVYLVEKGLDIPFEPVNIVTGENRTPELLKKNRLAANLKVMDAKIDRGPFVAGSRPSIADCTLLAALEFAEFAQVPLDPAFKNVTRWYAGFKERPSARA